MTPNIGSKLTKKLGLPFNIELTEHQSNSRRFVTLQNAPYMSNGPTQYCPSITASHFI